MAMLEDDEALIICNGYKDEEYIETALLASKLGQHGDPRRREARRARRSSPRSPRRVGVQPRIGMRVKLSSRGVGQLGGVGRRPLEVRPLAARAGRGRSSFMRGDGLLDCFELLHFHLGTQISDIRIVKNALREAGALLRRAAQAGRAAQVPRRRRRPRRRLRRLADQLRLVDELHDAGVRERRRLRDAGDLRRRRACRTRPSSPSRAARSSRTTRCWSSTSSASASSTSARCPSKLARRRAAAW